MGSVAVASVVRRSVLALLVALGMAGTSVAQVSVSYDPADLPLPPVPAAPGTGTWWPTVPMLDRYLGGGSLSNGLPTSQTSNGGIADADAGVAALGQDCRAEGAVAVTTCQGGYAQGDAAAVAPGGEANGNTIAVGSRGAAVYPTGPLSVAVNLGGDSSASAGQGQGGAGRVHVALAPFGTASNANVEVDKQGIRVRAGNSGPYTDVPGGNVAVAVANWFRNTFVVSAPTQQAQLSIEFIGDNGAVTVRVNGQASLPAYCTAAGLSVTCNVSAAAGASGARCVAPSAEASARAGTVTVQSACQHTSNGAQASCQAGSGSTDAWKWWMLPLISGQCKENSTSSGTGALLTCQAIAPMATTAATQAFSWHSRCGARAG
ncbi:MAG TPA: hypothetical protein VM681_06585 [Candidatus Thermoplasmatota archaeon]|nr:hypothetical protein [Candidatus Thermoplasmatota archaeon]